MSKRTRKSYDKTFKLMEVEMYRNSKAACTMVKDLSIGVDMLRSCAKEHDDAGSLSFPGNGTQDLTPEQK